MLIGANDLSPFRNSEDLITSDRLKRRQLGIKSMIVPRVCARNVGKDVRKFILIKVTIDRLKESEIDNVLAQDNPGQSIRQCMRCFLMAFN